MSHYSQLRQEFFDRVNAELVARSRNVPAGSSGGANWQRHNLGITGIHLASAVKKGEMKAELVVERPDAKFIFDRLVSEKRVIERDFGAELKWFGPDATVKRARITSFNPAPDIERRSDWEPQVAWLVAKLDHLFRVFYPRVSRL